jgi:hypothetical protein
LCIHSDEGLLDLNYDVVTLESQVEAQKRKTEGSWMAKIQRAEELNRSTRVTDALLPSIHVVAVDIANCERARQTARVSGTRFDRQLSKLTDIVAVRPHLNDDFLSRLENCAYLDYVNEKRMPGRSQLFSN